jgi:hypothetical protein
MKIEIIMVAYERYEELEIAIRCFRIQTNPNWVLHIVYDGKAPQGIINIVAPYLNGDRADSRIHFYESPERYQNYGHPNRRAMLQAIECNPNDFILMTNEDNYYVPRFVEFMLKAADPKTGIIYCNTVHSHFEYNLNSSELHENSIDMGAFMVRADAAKSTGFNHDHFSADGTYAEECVRTCQHRGLKMIKVHKPLFIHN